MVIGMRLQVFAEKTTYNQECLRTSFPSKLKSISLSTETKLSAEELMLLNCGVGEDS